MKKTLKISGYIIGLILFLLVIFFVTASLSQKKIVDFALKNISEKVSVPVKIDDLSFTLIKRFPFATIEFSGVRIGAPGANEASDDSVSFHEILFIKDVFVSFKTIPLFKGEFEIIKIELDEACINYKVDSLGKSNIDFLLNFYNTSITDSIDSGTKNQKALPVIDLKKIKLKNTHVVFVNDSLKIAANLLFPSLDLTAKIENEKFTGSIKGDLQLSKCKYTTMDLSQFKVANFEFELDYKPDTLQINSLEVKSEEAAFSLTGKLTYNQNFFADLQVESKRLEIGKLVKFIPDEIVKDYGIEKLDGNMHLAGTIKGNVSDSVVPAMNFTFGFKDGWVKTSGYPLFKKISFTGKFSNGSERNNATTGVIFDSFHAETENGTTADLTLSLNNLDELNYTLKSRLKLGLDEFAYLLPDSVVQNISGDFFAKVSTKGKLPVSVDNHFINQVVKNTAADITFSNFRFTMDSLDFSNFSGTLIITPGKLIANNVKGSVPDYNFQLNNSSFNAEYTGEITSPETLEILLSSFQAELPQGKFWGTAKIKNPDHPDIFLDAEAEIDLAGLKPFLPDSLVHSISGNLGVQLITEGQFKPDSIMDQIPEILFKRSKLRIKSRNVLLAMSDTLQKISELNGNIKLEEGTISVSDLNGVVAGMDFSIDSAIVSNVFNTVIKNQKEKVFAQGIFTFGEFDYSVLAPLFQLDSIENTSMSTGRYEINNNTTKPVENAGRNYTFEFKGKFAAKSIKYDKIFLEDVTAKFNLTDSVYIVDQFKTKAFEGNSVSSLRYSLSDRGRQIINLKNHAERMDITKFLYAFDNFGYDSLISYENISGLFSGDLNSRFVFDADTLVTSDMRALGNLALENGRIVNYEPAMEVSKFTGIKELDNIELKTLKCNVFLFKNHMYVPVTDIVSSSMDLSTFGMQSLNDDYEYHLQMKLSEILKGKSKKLFERQKSVGDDIDDNDLDGNTIRLIYAYTDGKQKMGFDTKRAQRAMERKIQVQQKMLELIFHPGLVSFETGVK